MAYTFVLVLAASVVIADFTTRNLTDRHPDSVVEVSFLILAVVLLSTTQTRIDRGRLVLAGIPIGAAALLLNPLDATVVGLSLGISMARRGRWALANAVTSATYAC